VTKIRVGNPDVTRAGSNRTNQAALAAADTSSAIGDTLSPTLEEQVEILNVVEHQLTLLVDRVMQTFSASTAGILRVDASAANVNVSTLNTLNAFGNLTNTAFMPNMHQQVFYTLRANIVTT
jgi:hypothetical protein